MPADPAPERPRATVGVYDRPPWWRSRRTLRLAFPVAAAVVSLIALYVFIA